MSDEAEQEVIVESSMGPEFGYYHRPAAGTWMGAKEMSREDAEELGYSRCLSCYRDTGTDEEVSR